MARAGTNHKGGRPKGSYSQKTLDRQKTLEAWRQRAMKVAQQLLDSQLSIAKGQQFLYKVVTLKSGMRSKPELITDEGTIRAYLNEELNEPDDAEFYFITTKEPNNFAIDSIMDRTFGKAAQSLQVEDPNGNIMQISMINVIPLNANKTNAAEKGTNG